MRMITDEVTFAGLIDAAFNQIRQYGRSSVAVNIRLLSTLAVIGEHVRTEPQRTALKRQAVMIKRASDETVPEAEDRQDIAAQYEIVMKILEWT